MANCPVTVHLLHILVSLVFETLWVFSLIQWTVSKIPAMTLTMSHRLNPSELNAVEVLCSYKRVLFEPRSIMLWLSVRNLLVTVYDALSSSLLSKNLKIRYIEL